MQLWLFILVNVLIAAFVGGLTNHFAIKMLFHPRNARYVMGRRIPFTPGLIPKRKEQIAGSLGDVVADYLVTPAGLRELVLRGSLQRSAAEKIRAYLMAAASEEGGFAPRDAALRFWNESEWDERKAKLAEAVRTIAARGIDRLWTEGGWKDRTIAGVVPGWSDEKIAAWAAAVEGHVTSALRDELLSPRGQKMLRELTTGLLDRAGGFLGALAGIFMDEDKVAAKLTPALIEQLHGEAVKRTLRGMVEKKLREAGDWSLERAAGMFAGEEEPLAWLQAQADKLLNPELRLEQLERIDLGGWLLRNEAVWTGWAQAGLDAAFGLLERNLERLVAALDLPALVKEQVVKFPIERLEHIILSVSGKEFRAITWLGAVLGGLIGLVQSILLRLMG